MTCYGYRKIHPDLRARKGEASIVSLNRLQRQFNPDAPDKRWVMDIPYIRILYLAVIVDLLVHSDQSSQHTSHEWQSFLKSHGLEGSTSRSGYCHDNAVAESVFPVADVKTSIINSSEVSGLPVAIHRDKAFWQRQARSYVSSK